MKKLYFAFAAMFFSAATFAQCTDLFFSEYVEGSSSNKALEIYNPTSVAINLNAYTVVQYNNGAVSPTYNFKLNGTIAAQSTYVIVNNSAAPQFKALADTNTTSQVMTFNGNDVLALVKGTDTLDRIGAVGDTANISFDTTNGLNRSYVRKPDVQQGTKNWSVGKLQWIAFPQDTAHLKAHTMNSCGAITDTLVNFSPNSSQVNESAGTYNITLTLNAASPSSTFTVDVELTGGSGSATDVNNYTTQTVTFNPGSSSNSVTLTITDDVLPEGAETLIFKLRNATGNLKIGADSLFTLTIGSSDIAAQTYSISQITGTDTAFYPDSLGVKVRISGTVLGIDYRANGVEFFIHDATDGVLVFSPVNSFGYTVAEGDSVVVEGEVGFFNGTTEVQFLDTIIKVGTGIVPTAVVVQDLDETTEAELVRINNVTLATPAQWTGTGASGFSCDITDGQNTWTLRIDEQCGLYSQPAPIGTFDVIGIGSQNDNSSPYNSGYQILPRFTSDLILHTGIKDLTTSTLTVYPNPNHGQFVVEMGVDVQNGVLNVFDVEGRVVYSSNVSGTKIQINTSNLYSGIYMLCVSENNITYRAKVNIHK